MKNDNTPTFADTVYMISIHTDLGCGGAPKQELKLNECVWAVQQSTVELCTACNRQHEQNQGFYLFNCSS